GDQKRIGITRIHMEEDAGKLIHDPDRPLSMVDFNRTGVPLIEIVSEPDIRSPEEAGIYLRHLRALVRYLDISDGNMEEGSFRCDANISVRPKGSEAFGIRTELKNLNSFKHVEKALSFEIARQIEVLEDGGQVIQETRLWDPDKDRSTSMRGKEEAHDYRYFPDPDLLPLTIDDDWIDAIQRDIPELPDEKKLRFMEKYHLPAYDAGILTSSRELADYFETCLADYPNAKQVSNWVMGSLMGLLNAQNKSIAESPISSKDLARLLLLMDDKTISSKMAKTVFDEMARTGKAPKEIVAEKGLVQMTDETAIKGIVEKVLQQCLVEVTDYKNGKTKLFGFFVGQVMKETKGKANPRMVNEILKAVLKNK
ncbi:MAG: Asp-tRNA(Asn)/Glu-tRNA(Gln) amidotransferase subunit GatB, partial [Desulfobacterales bacterium]